MPPKYFAYIDGEQKGPFTLDQLAESGVRPSTYVWCKGMDDWQRADQVEEIRNQFRHHIEKQRPVEEQAQQMTHPGNSADLNKVPGEEAPLRFPLPDLSQPENLDRPPQVSMVLAVLSLLLCFPPTGFVAVFFTYKAQKTWEKAMGRQPLNDIKSADGISLDDLKRKAHDYERLSKMWLGLTVAFGVIFWTLVFSVRK